MNTYLLIDNAMLTASGGAAIAVDARPDWLACVYEDPAAKVSPHLIDLDAVHAVGQMDRVMALVNATPMKLPVSIIDSVLSLAELVQHLRHFIMVKEASGKKLTLRFADSAVLPELAKALTSEQWSALAWPMARWLVHGYDGQLQALPSPDRTAPRATVPLVLTALQLTALQDAMLPNRILASLRDMRHGAALPGSAADQHRWASESTSIWRNAGNAHDIVLRWLTSAALETHGAVLRKGSVGALLAQSDVDAIRVRLDASVAEHRAKSQFSGERQ